MANFLWLAFYHILKNWQVVDFTLHTLYPGVKAPFLERWIKALFSLFPSFNFAPYPRTDSGLSFYPPQKTFSNERIIRSSVFCTVNGFPFENSFPPTEPPGALSGNLFFFRGQISPARFVSLPPYRVGSFLTQWLFKIPKRPFFLQFSLRSPSSGWECPSSL